jgi:hypothetical protein
VDIASDRSQDVYTVHLKNGDPNQVATVLQGMFGGTTQRTGTPQSSALQTRAQQAATTSSYNTSGGLGTMTGGTTP